MIPSHVLVHRPKPKKRPLFIDGDSMTEIRIQGDVTLTNDELTFVLLEILLTRVSAGRLDAAGFTPDTFGAIRRARDKFQESTNLALLSANSELR